jgi:hypothetical protein
MDEKMTKEKVLELIRSKRATLEEILKPLSEEQMTQPGAQDDWCVKDILAHIADWEQRMVQWVEESLRGDVPERPAPGLTWDDLDLLNERTYLKNKDRPLQEILAEFDGSYQQALGTVEYLDEEDLIEPDRFGWREGDPLWHMIAANTWWHYDEHYEAIANWLKEA